MNEENSDYKKAILDTQKLYINYQKQDKEAVGYAYLDTTHIADTILVKQNNTIIHLLISISEKLNKILDKTTNQNNLKDLEEITTKLSSLELGTRKPRKSSTSQPWQFFQVAPEQ